MNIPDQVLEEDKVQGDTTPHNAARVDLAKRRAVRTLLKIFNLFVLQYTAYVSCNFYINFNYNY
ncbi:MAG: hypothetical protein MJA30_29190 [Cytophagales bacterium]|nr:hypothetical protein [Cytophagales bacterium]